MNHLTRAFAVGAILIALFAALLTACPALAQEAGLDFWHVPDLRARMADSDQEYRELERKGEIITRRTCQRAEAVRDLIDGRIPVEDAIRQFVDLNRLEPPTLSHSRWIYPGNTDEERAGWQLVAHLRAQSDPRAEIVADETACRLLEKLGTGGCCY